jgi:hypothetical protein
MRSSRQPTWPDPVSQLAGYRLLLDSERVEGPLTALLRGANQDEIGTWRIAAAGARFGFEIEDSLCELPSKQEGRGEIADETDTNTSHERPEQSRYF